MCIDYTALNKQTTKDQFLLSSIDSFLERLGQAKVFTKLDLACGYHQIAMEETSIQKNSFSYYIWKILRCCNNAKGHCRNAPCNSSIAAMMQQREHCGNALQYCGNMYCGNAEGHCKQHQHCGNIAAIRALLQCPEVLQQYPFATMRCRVAAALWQCDRCGGVASCSPWRLIVVVGLLVSVDRGTR